MVAQIVSYQLDDDSLVQFEIEPSAGFQPAGGDDIAGRVSAAVEPAIAAAKIVLAKVRETRPDAVEVTFGIKVSGRLDWIVARAASEANFEIKLTWNSATAETAPEKSS